MECLSKHGRNGTGGVGGEGTTIPTKRKSSSSSLKAQGKTLYLIIQFGTRIKNQRKKNRKKIQFKSYLC